MPSYECKLKAFLETERRALLRTCLKCTSAYEAGAKHREGKGLVGHARRLQWQPGSRSAQSAGLGDTAPGEKTGSGSFYNLQAKHENAFSTHSNGKDQSWQCSSKSLGDGRWAEVGEAEERTGPLFHCIESTRDKTQRFKDCVLFNATPVLEENVQQ